MRLREPALGRKASSQRLRFGCLVKVPEFISPGLAIGWDRFKHLAGMMVKELPKVLRETIQSSGISYETFNTPLRTSGSGIGKWKAQGTMGDGLQGLGGPHKILL